MVSVSNLPPFPRSFFGLQGASGFPALGAPRRSTLLDEGTKGFRDCGRCPSAPGPTPRNALGHWAGRHPLWPGFVLVFGSQRFVDAPRAQSWRGAGARSVKGIWEKGSINQTHPKCRPPCEGMSGWVAGRRSRRQVREARAGAARRGPKPRQGPRPGVTAGSPAVSPTPGGRGAETADPRDLGLACPLL